MGEKTLHIYAQGFWHDTAYIVGDRAGLTALRDALNVALEKGCGACEPFASDGEGYETRVELCEDEATWKALQMPYTDTDMDIATWKGKHPAYVFDDRVDDNRDEQQEAKDA